MPKYRKKPVVIEAWQWHGTPEDAKVVVDWVLLNGGKARYYTAGNTIAISTLEGTMGAQPGDFIIQGVQGEFYPCKPDIFEATYESYEEVPV